VSGVEWDSWSSGTVEVKELDDDPDQSLTLTMLTSDEQSTQHRGSIVLLCFALAWRVGAAAGQRMVRNSPS